MPLLPEAIPQQLKELRQWVAWQWVLRGGRFAKVPVDPKGGGRASSVDPGTWGDFEHALRYAKLASLPGVGYVFHPNDPFCGIDLDACRDPRTDEMADWALEEVRRLNSYAEVSPTGTGAKVFVRAEKPLGRNRKGGIEIYDRDRFFTVTGHCLQCASVRVEGRQAELSALHRRLFGERKEEPPGAKQRDTRNRTANTDDEILRLARNAANGEKFRRLWSGDTSLYATEGNAGRSEADLALCSLLAFWVGPDEDRVDRLFRQSGLYREKWARRADYRALTLAAALGRDEFWTGSGARGAVRGISGRRGTVEVGPPTPGAGVAGKADHRLG